MLDRGLIEELRDFIQMNDERLCNLYCDRNGNNDWNAICSSCDWAEVATDSLIGYTIEIEHSNKMSFSLVTLIMAIDILNESISTLSKKIFSNNIEPFSDEDSIFKGRIETQNGKPAKDNVAFKRIRAIYATHQTDISNSKVKKYASWSYPGFDRDVEIRIYDARAGFDDEIIDFNIEELKEFISKRYNYIKDILMELKKQLK